MKIIKPSSLTFLIIIIVSLATSPAFAFDDEKKNIALIAIMAISPLIILIYKKIYSNDIPLLLFMSSIILFPAFLHPETMRWSTVMYTAMFGLTFLAYKLLLYHNNFRREIYLKVLKYLIFAYVLVLLIQQFCVLTGIPIFNVSNYRLNEPWKLNSLTSEPSTSARIVALLMFSYITIKELIILRKYDFRIDFKTDKWVWLSFIWTMVTMGSGTAFLFLAMVLLKFVRLKSLAPLLVIFLGITLFVNALEIVTFERTFRSFMAVLTLDSEKIYEADHSAAFRIIPLIILAQRIGFTSINDWFGYGVDFVGSFLSDEVRGLPEGWTSGGLLQLWVDYGFVVFILFITFNLINIVKKGDYLSMAFWFMIVFIQGINNQILWLGIVLLFTNKYFKKSAEKRYN